MDRFLQWWRVKAASKYVNSGDVVCDFGCGLEGYFLHSVSGKISIGYGFDLEVGLPENDKIKLNRVNLGGKIPLADEIADRVVALAVIEHLDNCRTFFLEALRILKPGGILVLTTPHRRARYVWELLSRLRLIQDNTKEHKHYFDAERFLLVLKEIGFSEVELKKFQFGFNQLFIARK